MWMIMSAIWNAIYGAIVWVLTIPKKLMGLSLPAQVALLVGVFLVLCVAIVGVAYLYNQELVPWRHTLTFGRVSLIAVLIVVIPIVVYKALKLWLEGEVSRFPDIDYAWKAGVTELERNGLNLHDVPLFLVLGSSGEQQERALFNAAGLGLRVAQTPQGPAALHWYANPDGIYLVLSEASCLSKLAELGRTRPIQGSLESPPGPGAMGGGGSSSNIRGTIMISDQPEEDRPAPRPAPGSSSNIRGTMVLDGAADVDGGASSPAMTISTAKQSVFLPPQEATLQALRLQYVCQLVRRARQPLCPLNGALTLLPFDVIEIGAKEGTEVQRAVKSDLDVIVDTLQVRCPVTAMVVGMEKENGFSELVHRVGRDRAAAQRFGKGYNVWAPPEAEQLEALSVHACGAFEDWVYTLFRERGSLSRPGNTKLYAMLCKIRRSLQSRLTSIITGGFGFDPEKNVYGDTLLFTGCYFAATGEHEDQQAFVRGVFDKLPELQEELEWTRAATAQQRRYVRLTYVGIAIDLLLVAALAGMIIKAAM